MTIADYLKKICYFVGLDEEAVEVQIQETDQRTEVKLFLSEDIANQFIGSGGRNLEAIQYLVGTTFKDELEGKKVSLDINNYLQDKESRLVESALRMASEVKKTGQAKTLCRLNSYERYLIHSAIGQDENLSGVSTYSTTVRDQRYLVICPVKDAP